MLHLVTLAAVLYGSWQAASAAAPSASDIRARLEAYERRTQQTGRPDPAALADIGRSVIERARRSPNFTVWSEACASTALPEGDCGTRLWAILNDPKRPLARRAEAASALMARKDPRAADALFDLLKSAAPATLAPLTPIISVMPPARAVPLLIRLLESSSTTHQADACRALGGFDTPDVREALTKVVSANPPGTPTWLICNVARARLREPDTRGALWGYGHDLEGDDLLYVAKAMVEVGNDSAGQVLSDLTHRGTPRNRLDAAALLADSNPDVAIPVIEAAQRDADPAMRAAALDAERRLKRVPPIQVRRMLADNDELVAIAAAEVAIDWAKRAQYG